MILQDLFEAVTQDLDAHRKALRAYHLFAGYVARLSGPDFTTTYQGQRVFGFETARAGIGAELGVPDLVVMLGRRSPRATGLSGGTVSFTKPVRECTRGLVLDCLRGLEFADVALAVNSVDFMNLFCHEYQHVLDDVRSGYRLPDAPHPSEDGEAAYLNHASEYNARYHDLAGDLLAILQGTRDDPQNARDYADLYGFTGDFRADLARLSAKTRGSRQFTKWLNDDRRRALLKRLYKLHHEIMVALKASDAERHRAA